jgi:hypothetical protein
MVTCHLRGTIPRVLAVNAEELSHDNAEIYFYPPKGGENVKHMFLL